MIRKAAASLLLDLDFPDNLIEFSTTVTSSGLRPSRSHGQSEIILKTFSDPLASFQAIRAWLFSDASMPSIISGTSATPS